MPTGYTAKLEELNYDVNKWVKTNLVRAFGICIALRDTNGDLSEKQIRNGIGPSKNDSESYHKTVLATAKARVTKLEKRTDADWKKDYKTQFDKAERDYAKRLKEHTEKKAKHKESLARITELHAKAEQEKQPEVVVNVLKYGMDQLTSTLDFDYGHPPYKEEILNIKSAKDWRTREMKKAFNQVDYHTENVEKEQKRNRGGNSVEEYDALVAFMDKNQ